MIMTTFLWTKKMDAMIFVLFFCDAVTFAVLVEQDVKSLPAAEADPHAEERPPDQSPGSVS